MPTPRPAAQYTLITLVAELREHAEAGEPQASLVERLHSLARNLGIRMRYDEHVEGPAARRFGGKKRGKRWEVRVRQIPTVIGRLRIQLSKVSEGSSFVGRIILSCDRQNIRVPLCAECNGAVIDAVRGPTSWCHRAPSPHARWQNKSTAPSASRTPTVRSGPVTTKSSRSATGHTLQLDSSGEWPNLVPHHGQQLRRFPPEVDGW